MNRKLIAVSGGFDPVHMGHVKMIQEASRHGDVIVILNSDDWLQRKKGYVFMPWDERAFILGNIKGVTIVTNVDDSDDTVCHALARHKPGAELGIELLWNIGGGKIQSSSDLVSNSRKQQGVWHV